MRKKLTHALAAALAALLISPAFADGPAEPEPDVAAPPLRAQPVAPAQPAAAPPEGQIGQIAMDDVNYTVPAGYKFYSAAEAQAYLQRNGAAAPQGAVLGLIARDGVDVRQSGAWATVVSYDSIGYVPRETAAGLEESNFEADVRSARALQNRPFEGFIVAPAFEPGAPSLTWAERAARPGAQGADLRHESKALGRYGVAALTSIGSADQLNEIAAAAPTLLQGVSFPDGRRHADFQPASDTVSAYTVPGLVTGVAAQTETAQAPVTEEGQTGFGGLSGWFPWIAAGVVGLGIVGYLLMRRRRSDDEDDEA